MQKELNVRISSKRDSRINWSTNNPVLLSGEMANIIINGRTFLKVGDGYSTFNDLAYLNGLILNLTKTQIEVPAESFTADSTYSTYGYNYRATISIAGVTAVMIPELMLSSADLQADNIYTIANSYDGGIHIYAKQQPATLITIPLINFWIETTINSIEALRAELSTKASKSLNTTATLLAANWSAEAPYTQTIEIIGLTGDRFENPEVIIELDDDVEVARLQQASWNKVSQATSYANSIEFEAWDTCPNVDIPIIIKVRY